MSDTRNDKTLAGGQLRQIIPAWNSPGFPGEGRISLTSLERDIEFGVLDGLTYEKADVRGVVTTPTLLQHWISDHNRWWDGSDNIPLRQKLLVRATPNPVRQVTLKRMLARSEVAYVAYQASKLKDQASFDASVRYDEQGNRACFAAHLREQPHYKEIVRQAQALVDLLH